MDCNPQGSSVHGVFQARNTGVGCNSLLQRIFPTEGLNPCIGRWQLAIGSPCSGFLPLADGESPNSDTTQWEAGQMLLSFPLFLSRGILHYSVTCCCSVTKLWPILCDSTDCSTPGFPVLYCPPELAQTHVLWFGDAIQPSRPVLSPCPTASSLSQHQALSESALWIRWPK